MKPESPASGHEAVADVSEIAGPAPLMASRDAEAVLAEGHDELATLLDECDRLMGDISGLDHGSVVSRLCAVILAHGQIEREILFPPLREATADSLVRMEDAQQRASRMAADVGLLRPGDEGFDARVAALTAAIRAQIKVERDELFPLLDDAPVDSDRLGARLDQRKAELITPAQAD